MSDRELRESEQIGAAIRAAAEGVEAPPSLRARLAEDRLREPPGRRRARRVLVPALGAAAAMAAVAIVLLVAGGESAPSLDDAARVALQAPTAPPPATDPRDDRFVQAEIGGVRFPNYTWFAERWSTAGARRDELSGRDALTVVYRDGGQRVGYTVVDGEPLAVPAGARRISHKGVRFAALRRGDALVLTWQHLGHTCVLASRGAELDEMLAWASWG